MRRHGTETGRRGRTLVPLVAVLALAGCSSSDDAASDASAVVSAAADVTGTADCLSPEVLVALGLSDGASGPVSSSATPHPAASPAGPVPADLVVASVVECTPGGPLVDTAGTWSSVRSRRLEGDTAPLVHALGGPRSAASATAGAGATSCASSASGQGTSGQGASGQGASGQGATEPMDVWLVDALGRAARVQVPTACDGTPQPAVTRALAALQVTDDETYPVVLVEPSPSATAKR